MYVNTQKALLACGGLRYTPSPPSCKNPRSSRGDTNRKSHKAQRSTRTGHQPIINQSPSYKLWFVTFAILFPHYGGWILVRFSEIWKTQDLWADIQYHKLPYPATIEATQPEYHYPHLLIQESIGNHTAKSSEISFLVFIIKQLKGAWQTSRIW